jgi:Putative DNA-binding domain
MTTLHEVQVAFRRAVLMGQVAPLATLIVADALAAEERIPVYRNNVFASLTKALRDTFPVVCRLIDEQFFACAAHEFVCCDPPGAPISPIMAHASPGSSRVLALQRPCLSARCGASRMAGLPRRHRWRCSADQAHFARGCRRRECATT